MLFRVDKIVEAVETSLLFLVLLSTAWVAYEWVRWDSIAGEIAVVYQCAMLLLAAVLMMASIAQHVRYRRLRNWILIAACVLFAVVTWGVWTLPRT